MFGWKQKMNAPVARNCEISGAMDGLLHVGQAGFVAGTHVISNLGWRAVEDLSVGDKVLTFDHGMQVITEIQHEPMFALGNRQAFGQCPVLVPKGAMNNRCEIWLMPGQGMLVESDAALDAMGDPFAVVPARALKGLRGICAAKPDNRPAVTTLAFANDEVIYVEGGMLAHCPRPRCLVTEDPAVAFELYNVLAPHAARKLVECMIDKDDVSAFVCCHEEIASVSCEQPYLEHPAMVV